MSLCTPLALCWAGLLLCSESVCVALQGCSRVHVSAAGLHSHSVCVLSGPAVECVWVSLLQLHLLCVVMPALMHVCAAGLRRTASVAMSSAVPLLMLLLLRGSVRHGDMPASVLAMCMIAGLGASR